MKGKIKNMLFVISTFYSLVIVIFMVIISVNLINTIELHDSKENKEKINLYKQQLATLEQNSCTEVINEIITHYEATSYNGEVSLREMFEYDFDNSLLSYFLKIRENCNLDSNQEKKYNLPIKFITSSIQRDELYQRYYFQYELNINDITRLIIEPQLSGVEYQINRAMELEIISDLIKIAKEEVSINE